MPPIPPPTIPWWPFRTIPLCGARPWAACSTRIRSSRTPATPRTSSSRPDRSSCARTRSIRRRLPVEDAKSLVFDDTLLFDVDKFSGYDRFETGTRANVGVQYTFQANNGAYARAVFGQSYHLAGENAFTTPGFDPASTLANPTQNFSPVSGLETNRSDYVAGLYLSPISSVSPDCPRPLRREGLDAAPAGYAAARQLRPDFHVDRLLLLAVRSHHGAARQAAGRPGCASACA